MATRSRSILFCAMIVALCLGLSGCGRLVTVEGQVLCDGKPLEEAGVVFIPQDFTERRAGTRTAFGTTDADGKFRLTTVDRQGVVPGKYKVTVSKKVPPPDFKPPPAGKLAMMPTWVEVLPAHYTDPERTPFHVEIPKEGKNDVLIELTSVQAAP